jgi:predicted transposase/invertase (TIGR01784 family)
MLAPNWRPLVRFDWAIKKLLRSRANFVVVEGFLSELLKRDIKILQVLESESNKNHEGDKHNRVDVVVQSDGAEIVLIEIQISSEYDFLQRMLYGTSKAVSDNLNEGQKYADVKKVYSINILYFDLGHGEDYIYHGTTSFVGIHKKDQLQLTKRQKELYQKEMVHEIYPEYYLLKVNQFNDVAKNTLDQWIYFLKNDEIKKNFHAKGLPEAQKMLDVMKLSKEERAKYEVYLRDLHYQASRAETIQKDLDDSFRDGKNKGKEEGIAEGRVEGRAKGLEEGRVEGRTEGREEGRIKGLVEGKLETARNLKKLGVELSLIIKATGLTAEEIEKA